MRYLMLLALCLSSSAWAQVNDTSLRVPLIQSSDPNAGYRLFPTLNFYTFLELNTSTGAISVMQWALEDDKRFKKGFNEPPNVPHPEKARKGRFTLYPTTNIFNFLLLDQDTGTAWQFQWSGNEGGTFAPIKSETELVLEQLQPSPSPK